MSFEQLKVSAELVGILAKNGIVRPTAVQEQTIPKVYSGRDVMAKAQTGTGKTLAFVIPMMEKIDASKTFVQALIIAPTRELALQITTEIKKLNKQELGVLTVCGGRDFESQKNKLQGKTQILVGTPGRLLDHLRKGNTDLGGVTYFVLDEVDEMLKQGFGEDISQILELTPTTRQTIMCSATMNEEVRKLGKTITTNCVHIDVDPENITATSIKQICMKVSEERKTALLVELIERYNPYLMLVFCYSKERAIALSDELATAGVNCDVLHGDMSKAARKTVMNEFRVAKLQVLVASDIAARGLDVEGITHVINYDIPHDVDWYVHRIGRTGRAGRDGMAVTFYTEEDVRWLRNIETKLNLTMEKQNADGKVVARRKVVANKPKKKTPTRGKNAVGPNKRVTKYAEASRKQKKSEAADRKRRIVRGKRLNQD